jgi:hypothetical protein
MSWRSSAPKMFPTRVNPNYEIVLKSRLNEIAAMTMGECIQVFASCPPNIGFCRQFVMSARERFA